MKLLLLPLILFLSATQTFGFMEGKMATDTHINGNPTVSDYMNLVDFDNDGIILVTDTLPTNNSRKLFYLNHRPLRRLIEVKVNGTVLDQWDPTQHQTDYYYDIQTGWITFRQTYDTSDTVEVSYEYSNDIDIHVSNTYVSFLPANIWPGKTYINNGNFDLTTEVNTWGKNFHLNTIDLDRDGDWEFHGNNLVYDNQACCSFAPQIFSDFVQNDPTYSNGTVIESAYGDINGDGHMDQIKIRKESLKVKLARSDAVGNYFSYWIPGMDHDMLGRHVEFFDFDTDGDADLLVGSETHMGPDVSGTYVFRTEVTQGPFLFGTKNRMSGPSHAYIGRYLTETNGDITYVSTISQDLMPESQYEEGNISGIADDGTHLFLAGEQVIHIRDVDEFHSPINTYSDPRWAKLGGIYVHNGYLYVVDRVGGGNDTVYRYLIVPGDLQIVNNIPFGCCGGMNNIITNSIQDITDVWVDNTHVYWTGTQNIHRRNHTNWAWQENMNNLANRFLQNPRSLTGDNGFLYVTDDNHSPEVYKIAKIDANFSSLGGTAADPVETFGGIGKGSGTDACDTPIGITINGNFLYVTDSGNNRLLTLTADTLTYVTETPYWAGSDIPHNRDILNDLHFTNNPMGPDNMMHRLVWSETGPQVTEVKSADVDNDGDLDIVVFSQGPDVGTRVYSNDGIDGNGLPIFTMIWEQPSITDTMGGDVGDINQDGLMDMVIVNESSTPIVQVYYSQGASGMSYEWGSNLAGDASPGEPYNDFTGSEVKLVDLDDDNDLDVVATAKPSGSHSGIVVFGNQGVQNKMSRIRATTIVNGTEVTIEGRFIHDGNTIRLISSEVK